MTAGGDEARRPWLLWTVGAAAALSYAAVFYPGAVSFDSAYQWWQARGGESTSIHGVGMTWIWRAANVVVSGPGAVFALQLLLFWSGLVLIAQRLSAGTAWRITFMLVAAGVPVCLVLFSHVWSDVMLMAALACALGLLLHVREGRRWLLLPACVLLFLAVTLRHNAIVAVFPLLVYAEHARNTTAGRDAVGLARTAGIALAAAALFFTATLLLERTVDRPRTTFAATQVWDLAAISLDTGTMLLPQAIRGEGLTLDDLRQAFNPYSNTSLFSRTKAGVMQPHFAPDDPLNGTIRRAWIDAIRAHPDAYLAHRWALSRALFGAKARDFPRDLLYVEGTVQYGDNPPVAPNTTRAHAWAMQRFDAMRHGMLLSPWPYLCLAALALALAARRSHARNVALAPPSGRERSGDARPTLAVLISGVLYAAPLPFVAPAAELRYVGWTCLAAVIGAALALAPPRRIGGA